MMGVIGVRLQCTLVVVVPGRSRPESAGVEVPIEQRIGWKLQREIVLLLAWGPAILLQLAHPLVAQGIADHSTFRTQRRGRTQRLYHTIDAMLQLCFGTEEQAQATVARINAIHDRVNGHLTATAGVFPAGTRYSAHDPALLAWVHATLLDMNLRVYARYVGPLAEHDKDRYCAEASAIETPFGIPAGRLPRSFDELNRYMNAMLASDEITVTDDARLLAREILYPPAPRLAAPGLALVRLHTVGLLPASIRGAYGISWSPRGEALMRVSARLVRAMLRLTPGVIRHWPAARRAARRAVLPA
jgi:uncharacterized protein (DUF2236 family)